MAKRPSKSETLTIRLDPKTRFMLEFVSRLRGQTITTVVERAIAEAANRATLEPEYNYRGNPDEPRTWRDFWSVSDGERALKIAAEPELHPTYEEEKRLAFAKAHWPFFYMNPATTQLRSAYVEILWPRIDEFIANHEETKHRDFFLTGKYMAEALVAAKIQPPEWPAGSKSGIKFPNDEEESDIPF